MKLNIKEAFPIDHPQFTEYMESWGWLKLGWSNAEILTRQNSDIMPFHQHILHYMRSSVSVGAPGTLLQLGRVLNGKSNSQGATINNNPHHLLTQQGWLTGALKAAWGLSFITSGFLWCRSASWLDKTFNNLPLTTNDLQVLPRGEIQYRSGWGLGRCSWYQLFVTVRGSSSPPHGWWLHFPTWRVNIWSQPLMFQVDWWSQLWLYTSKQWNCSLWWGRD